MTRFVFSSSKMYSSPEEYFRKELERVVEHFSRQLEQLEQTAGGETHIHEITQIINEPSQPVIPLFFPRVFNQTLTVPADKILLLPSGTEVTGTITVEGILRVA